MNFPDLCYTPFPAFNHSHPLARKVRSLFLPGVAGNIYSWMYASYYAPNRGVFGLHHNDFLYLPPSLSPYIMSGASTVSGGGGLITERQYKIYCYADDDVRSMSYKSNNAVFRTDVAITISFNLGDTPLIFTGFNDAPSPDGVNVFRCMFDRNGTSYFAVVPPSGFGTSYYYFPSSAVKKGINTVTILGRYIGTPGSEEVKFRVYFNFVDHFGEISQYYDFIPVGILFLPSTYFSYSSPMLDARTFVRYVAWGHSLMNLDEIISLNHLGFQQDFGGLLTTTESWPGYAIYELNLEATTPAQMSGGLTSAATLTADPGSGSSVVKRINSIVTPSLDPKTSTRIIQSRIKSSAGVYYQPRVGSIIQSSLGMTSTLVLVGMTGTTLTSTAGGATIYLDTHTATQAPIACQTVLAMNLADFQAAAGLAARFTRSILLFEGDFYANIATSARLEGDALTASDIYLHPGSGSEIIANLPTDSFLNVDPQLGLTEFDLDIMFGPITWAAAIPAELNLQQLLPSTLHLQAATASTIQVDVTPIVIIVLDPRTAANAFGLSQGGSLIVDATTSARFSASSHYMSHLEAAIRFHATTASQAPIDVIAASIVTMEPGSPSFATISNESENNLAADLQSAFVWWSVTKRDLFGVPEVAKPLSPEIIYIF